MKRWRPLAWLLVSLACFIAAFYFWRLGDKWEAEKKAPSATATASNAPGAQATSAPTPVALDLPATMTSASTAPIAALSHTNNSAVQRTNSFPYRLSNTTQTVGELSRNSHAILLENAVIDSDSSTPLAIPDSLRSHGDPGAYLVQAHGPMNNASRAQIAAAGATIVSYFPVNTYLVTCSAAAASQLSGSFTVRPWEPYFKVKASLMRPALNGQGISAANVVVFPDAVGATKAALEKMGVTVVTESHSPFGTQLALRDIGSIAGVAGLPGVQIIEPSAAKVTANDLTRVIMNVSSDVFVPTNYLGLSGSNVLVAVADSWIPTNGASTFNLDLTNVIRDINAFPIGVADNDGHATHVGGIIAGSGLHSPTNAVGSPPFGDFRGKANKSTIWAQPAFSPFFTDAMLQESAARTNALISNNSWGYGTTEYNLAAASYDQAVRDSLPGATGSQQIIYVFAAGNDGQGDDDGKGGIRDTLLSPAVSKNAISVGASELPRGITNDVAVCDSCNDSNSPVCFTNKPWADMTDSSNQVARFSARGNVGIGLEGDFGRFKPDLIAPGTFVVSTRSPTWDTNAYYNPVTIDTQPFFNRTVPTNGFRNFSVFVPCDSFRLDISAVSVRPTNIDLPIYVRASDFPQPPANLEGTNFVSIPSTTLALTPVNTVWYYTIGNPTNVPVTFDTTSFVYRTNELGTYWDVLRTNLNDQLISSNGQALYRYESGTSMAAPAVAGTLALMEDFFTNRWHYTPSPALMKALLINGARSINPIYDFQVKNGINYQGWGLVNLTNSLPPGITNSFGQAAPMVIVDQDPTNGLATGDSRTLFVHVDTNALSAPLRVTLVWTDPPGNPAASIKLVNDLDLIVTNLDTVATTNLPQVIYFGNDFPSGIAFSSEWDGNTNSFPSDNVNNVENVYIPGTLGTNYSITVVARNVNVNAVTAHTNGVVQDYALVISSGNGAVTNALTLTNGLPVATYRQPTTTVTNQFAESPDTSGGLLTGQRVGASSPLQGTNIIAITNQTMWGTNGQITLGVTNQWHFYVITNLMGSNATTTFTNAAFATFLPPGLSIPPVGVNGTHPDSATRPEADIDLYVARGPNAWGLTNLDPAIVAAADKSLGREGTEFIVYSNALPDEVFYIGVKSEDQEASEYDFLALFSQFPFSTMGPNGEEYLRGVNVPTFIPDGKPERPGVATTIAIAVQPISVRRVVVTNDITHENFGDLVGTLQHNRIPVVLNNHTFGNGQTNFQIIYEDNDEGDTPGSQHPDGPGSLQDFIGQQGLGLWLLSQQDNAEFNTGRVDHVFIKLDPQSGTNGVVATIQPGQFFYDFIDVPPEATNLTVCVNFLPGSTGPVQLYLRYGDQPTLVSYDYTKTITSPGSCLTVGRTDLPPLRPGRYFVGIFNPTASPQTVRLTWSFGLDPNGVTPTPVTTQNPPTPLLDDAVTNSTIFITNNQNIVSVNVGVVLQHPRVSDLDLTLVSPSGQRIMLFENRGGISATNMGHLNITTNFFGSTTAGQALANTNPITPVLNSGTLIVDYDFFGIPDSMDVYYDGVDIFSSGLVSGKGTFIVPYGPGADTTLYIVMNQGNNSDPGTQWTYIPRVVTEDFTYLTFTDNTNFTDIPIKFAVPPYDAFGNDGTNFSLTGFETATNGEYIAPRIIPDLLGGWTMTTNDVFIRTNYFAGTNLLSMATNEVSVVTDPSTAGGGSNYLALARGSIARTVSLSPNKTYTLSYLYRGPGIAGWYRGEGDATDSADPEALGNNGSLIGRFNFPAGEVGQAFAMEDPGLAFQFAGTNTYVQVRQAQSLDVGRGSGFTVEGWINPTNINFQQPVVEWLAPVPTNTVVRGQSISNFVIQAGPFLNRANGHYYYLLGQTNWSTSELWAQGLGGHLVELDDANEQNWVYDTFAQFAGSNYTMWIGLTNGIAPNNTFVWSTGAGAPVYTNWAFGQPTNCASSHYTAILGPTNGLPGLWTVLDNNGLTCGGGPTNKPLGVVEVNNIQTNGVQFWISVTNAATQGNGRLYANIYDTNGVPHEFFSPAGLIQSNMFQHVALTYNTNTGVATFYYAGTNVASTNLGIFVPKTGGDVLIGKDMSRVTNNFFWGKMDEISIYRRFLSPSEILAIYRISAGTTNRNIGKFDPGITPALSLAEAQVSFGDVTNLIYGNSSTWQVHGFSLRAASNTLPVRITGVEPGMLLDSFSLSEKPPANLYYFPEQPLQSLIGSNAFGNWTLEIRDARTGAVSTNAELVSWQLQFILQTNISPPIQLTPQNPGTNTVPPGQIAYFTVTVPSWANNATNILVSATAPVDLLFNQTAPPGTGAGGDFTFVNNNTTGSQMISAIPPSTPPLLPGQTYYLAVRNNGGVPSTVVVRVDFNLTTLTNGIPLSSRFNTNEIERPFLFNVSSNATEATFQLLQVSGNADLVVRKGLPLPSLLSADYGSFSGSNADETIYVLTNSLPVPLSPGPWYLEVIKRNPTASNVVNYAVLAKELTNAPQVINLANRVPLVYTAGPGAALTNFFKFSVTNFPISAVTNLGIHFELFNQTGNGDLTVQTNFLPLAPPFFQSSRLPSKNAEIIFIRTNSALTNLNMDWYLGVPNNETNPITFTILAEIDTNGFVSFPAAEGAGSFTRGGSFSNNVYHVTHLGDSGAGSLRNGVTSLTGGGTIVFDVSGTINLSTPLLITNSFLTIAGQTAPGDGITVAGATTYVQGVHDVIMRYLRFRPTPVSSSVVWSGSFEGGFAPFEYHPPAYFDGGWHVDSGSIDLLTNGPPVAGSVPYDGNYFIDINGGAPGQVSTNISTVPGSTYSVNFAYAKNPNAGSAASVALLANGQALGIATDNQINSFSALNWHTTSFVFTATSPSTLLTFASTNTFGASGLFLDAVSLTLTGPSKGPDSLRFTNVSNVVIDHVSAGYATNDIVSVLNSSNVTVQWSVIANSLNTTNIVSGGSEIRYGSGNVTYHHNLYADNYSGNPTIGENVSLDFVNNVIFNWGLFSGFSTNDLANNPGGLTNLLNYSANYLIAGSNSVFTNVAFWGGTTNTWIFQTNNVIDTNRNSILDGANTSWAMFSNKYTPFSHAFDVAPPIAPDEAFIAYERVLDFAGTSLFSRDSLDRGLVQRARLRPSTTTSTFLSGMVAWWKAENNTIDSVNGNNITANNIVYTNGEVAKAFQYNGSTSFITASASPTLAVSNLTFEGWIFPTTGTYEPIIDYGGPGQQSPVHFWVNGLGLSASPGVLYANIRNTSLSLNTGAIVPQNTWSHVAFTLNVNTGAAAIYFNGAQVASTNLPLPVSLASTFVPVNIGYRDASSSEALRGARFTGRLDEISIYNRALAPCEILAIYNSGTNGKAPLLAGPTNFVSTLPYADADQDGIPDFWEITLNESLTNFSATVDRDGNGYTDLEEYINWLGVPHGLALHNTSTNIDLYVLSGNTGNLLFGVANGTNGTVYLTNSSPCTGGGSSSIAVFTPTNNFGNGTNGGFGSFTYMVTNTDTMAYFGPVTVSMFVTTVPITNVALATNMFIFTNPPNVIMDEMTTNTVVNTANPPNGVTYTLSPTSPPWATIDPTTGIITLKPLEPDGPTNIVITTVATDTNVPPQRATNTFTVTVNEVNRPPVFIATPPNTTNSALVPITVTNAATDPDIPANPLTYILLNAPTGATIDPTTGIITWTPTAGQAPGVYTITTVVTDTNAYALFNNTLSATNSFTITLVPAIGPFAFTQPAQAVTGTSAKLNGMVTPNGFATMAWFEWGTNTLYGNQTPPVNVGTSLNVVYTTANISGLTPNVPYHFRLVVSNAFAGIVTGFDQILDEAKVVVWGADYVKQAEVPPGLSNIVAIAGAYDHSLALRDNGTIVAWGDNTFSQTNVPAGLNNILAVAGGQYSSLALKTGGTVAAWGGNILSVTNVPPGLNNVVMIGAGTYASLALQANGNIVTWGANFFNVTTVPPGLNNAVEVAGGSYHSLAIRNNGTVVAWGDNSAGQTNVPPTATNVVAIAGGNYHSLALRADGTVVAWGDNSAGQTNVPPGLNNVIAVAAGGFHSLALKSDGTVVGWGDNTAGQANIPAGLSNVVAISSGYFHSLALTPTLLSTNPIVLNITNGVPQTNSVLSGSIVYYRVDVPVNADAATNTLIFTVNGPLNVWYSTNVPPTVGQPVDFQLLTNAVSGTSVVSTATSPQLIAGGTYYLGLQNTNAFAISYAVQVDFHLVPVAPLTNGVPSTNSTPSGGITFYQVDVPANADIATNSLLFGTGPLNVWFTTNFPPTITNANDLLLITNAPNGTSIFTTNTTPQLIPGTTYYIGVQNTNASAVTYTIKVDFHLVVTIPPPVPISGIIHTNINGTNGFLLVWFAPSTNLFQVQWTPTLPTTNWNTFTNIISYHTFIDPTNSEFEFFDDGSQTGGFGPSRFYRLILLNSNSIPALTGGVPATNSVPPGSVSFYRVDAPGNVNYATNLLLSATAPVNIWMTTNVPPSITNGGDVLLITNATSGSFTSVAGSVGPPFFTPNQTYYLGIENTNATAVTYAIEVDFHPISTPPSTNPVPISSIIQTNSNGTNGFLLVWFAPTNDLFQVQWTPTLPTTNWNTFTNIIAYHSFIAPTNSEFEFFDDGSQTGGFGPSRFYRLILFNPTNAIVPLTNGVPATNSTPAGTVSFLRVNVPVNADSATNALLSATGSVNVWFTTNAPPSITNANDLLLITNGTAGSSIFGAASTPLLVPGGTYYLGVQNTNATPVDYAIQVNFHLISVSTNPVPISITATNVGGTNSFLLTWFAPTNYLFQVQWTPTLPTNNWNTFPNIITYSTFITPTNSKFTFLDDGSQTGGFGTSRFYRLILANSVSSSVIPLTNGVPLTFTTAVGFTNFFSFDVTQTNAAVLFELYNLNGNGDLTAQKSNLPVTLPYLASTNSGTNYEQIVVRTNGLTPNINAISWFLGVPNQSTNPITYTIRAVVPTNGLLISGLPFGTTAARPGGTNVQLAWAPAVNGEKYEVRTNSNLGSTNWGAVTSLVASGTSMLFADPTPPGTPSTLFYRIVQVP
jgi:subtilisin-like proprotein convertase family protein